jgi:hypothetical protein
MNRPPKFVAKVTVLILEDFSLCGIGGIPQGLEKPCGKHFELNRALTARKMLRITVTLRLMAGPFPIDVSLTNGYGLCPTGVRML